MKQTNSTPLVTVIMPAYNAEKYIEESIRSVLAQTLTDWELIIVDDASSDGPAEIAQKFAEQDHRIHVKRKLQNRGVAEARNDGICLSRGEFVALLDSDDLWRPDKLERQLALQRERNADIVYSSYALMDESGALCARPFVVKETTSFREMLARNEIGCLTALVRREALGHHSFSSQFAHEDYVLWMELLRDGCRAYGVTDVLADYRVMRGTRSADKQKSAKNRWRVYREALHLSPVVSAIYFIRYAVSGLLKYHF